MKRGFFAALLAAALFGVPGRAEANMWDWIQDMSGPGPSNGRGNALATLCFDKSLTKFRPIVASADQMKGFFVKKPCAFIDVRRFENTEEDNFPAKVKLTLYDFGPTWELLDGGPMEFGFGLGFMQAEGTSNTTGNRESGSHFTVTIFRLVLQPLNFIPGKQDKKWLAWFKWYYRMQALPGKIDATDFGVAPGTGPGQSTFSATNDIVRSTGFIFDLGELLRKDR
jgi:hypothetical protein